MITDIKSLEDFIEYENPSITRNELYNIINQSDLTIDEMDELKSHVECEYSRVHRILNYDMLQNTYNKCVPKNVRPKYWSRDYERFYNLDTTYDRYKYLTKKMVSEKVLSASLWVRYDYLNEYDKEVLENETYE